MEILLVGIIAIYILQKNNKVNTGKFINDNGNWLRKFKESDYDFLVRSKYGDEVDPDILFDKRIQNALIISVALNSIKWFQKFLQTVFFLPYVTNAVAVGLVFSVIFDKAGIINFLFNTNITWIYGAERWTAMVPLCAYIIWSSIPFKILVFLSGLQGIDKQYYQAAAIDACSKTKVLTRITIPLLSPQILYIMITSFIGAFKEYTSVVSIFGGPGTLGAKSTTPNMETIVYYVYDNLASNTSWAGAAAVFLFAIILAFTGIQFAVSKKRVHY